MNSKPWQEHFPEEFKTLQASLGAATDVASLVEENLSSLRQALTKKVLPEEKYFSWAQNQYQLPLLKLTYFTDRQLDGHIWQKFQTAYPWNPDFLPVAEWEGHLLVACLEPKKLPQSLKAIYVLCPLAGLQQLWQKYQHTSEFQLSDEIASPELEAADESEELLEGLALDKKSDDDFGFDGLLSKTSPVVVLEKTNITNAVSVPVPSETNIGPAPVAATPRTETISSVSRIIVNPPTPPPTQSASVLLNTGDKKERTLSPVGRESLVLEMIQKDKKQLFLTECRAAFAQMKESFTTCFLLSADVKGLCVRPVAGDESFVENPQIAPTSLKEPSIFRIVDRTQKPFHGPVSLNEINEKFFEDWCKGVMPNHITLVPLVSNDKVIGMLMGLGEATAYNRPTLQLVEKIAQDMLTKFIPTPTIKAA